MRPTTLKSSLSDQCPQERDFVFQYFWGIDRWMDTTFLYWMMKKDNIVTSSLLVMGTCSILAFIP